MSYKPMAYSTEHGDQIITESWRFGSAEQAMEAAVSLVPAANLVKAWADASDAPVTHGIRTGIIYSCVDNSEPELSTQ